MLKELLSDGASLALSKSLQGAAARQEALASNIANVETPGYTRKDVRFEDALQGALNSGDPDSQAAALESLSFSSSPDLSHPANPDGNNVDIEVEMSELAKNSLRFDGSGNRAGTQESACCKRPSPKEGSNPWTPLISAPVP